MHVELFLEEPSAEAFIDEFLPKVVPAGTTWKPIIFQGKADLLKNLESRLKGYSKWIPPEWRLVVLVDKDQGACTALKARLEAAAAAAGFPTKTNPKAGQFVVLNRIAIEELEAWFFGDVPAIVKAFPGVSPHLGSKAAYRIPDAIAGGTWEALERVLQGAGYFEEGIAKIRVAREIAVHMDPLNNRSTSFNKFISGLAAL
jgi:hypothetical protein